MLIEDISGLRDITHSFRGDSELLGQSCSVLVTCVGTQYSVDIFSNKTWLCTSLSPTFDTSIDFRCHFCYYNYFLFGLVF